MIWCPVEHQVDTGTTRFNAFESSEMDFVFDELRLPVGSIHRNVSPLLANIIFVSVQIQRLQKPNNDKVVSIETILNQGRLSDGHSE